MWLRKRVPLRRLLRKAAQLTEFVGYSQGRSLRRSLALQRQVGQGVGVLIAGHSELRLGEEPQSPPPPLFFFFGLAAAAAASACCSARSSC